MGLIRTMNGENRISQRRQQTALLRPTNPLYGEVRGNQKDGAKKAKLNASMGPAFPFISIFLSPLCAVHMAVLLLMDNDKHEPQASNAQTHRVNDFWCVLLHNQASVCISPIFCSLDCKNFFFFFFLMYILRGNKKWDK